MFFGKNQLGVEMALEFLAPHAQTFFQFMTEKMPTEEMKRMIQPVLTDIMIKAGHIFASTMASGYLKDSCNYTMHFVKEHCSNLTSRDWNCAFMEAKKVVACAGQVVMDVDVIYNTCQMVRDFSNAYMCMKGDPIIPTEGAIVP